jgi:hypothetical protein
MLKKLLAAAFVIVMGAGCATTGLEPIDFSRLKGAREARFPAAGTWQSDEKGTIANVIPMNADPEAVSRSVNGIGVSSAVIEGFSARDFVLKCRLSFEGSGAPSVMFRVVEQDGVILAMYSVAVFSRGITLWRYRDGDWAPLGTKPKPMFLEDGRPYVLRIEARGDTITVDFDGDRLFDTRDSLLPGPGGIGLCGREGPCRFHELRVKRLDKGNSDEGT